MRHAGKRTGFEGLQNDAAIVLWRNLCQGEIYGEESGHAQHCDRHPCNHAPYHIDNCCHNRSRASRRDGLRQDRLLPHAQLISNAHAEPDRECKSAAADACSCLQCRPMVALVAAEETRSAIWRAGHFAGFRAVMGCA
jgi:hypothetical protein